MSDDYLWDGSGKPDPEVERLESVLRRLRHNRPAPHFTERPGLVERVRLWLGLPRTQALRPYAVVVAVAVVIVGMWLTVRWRKPAVEVARKPGIPRIPEKTEPKPTWDVARLAGTATIGPERLGDAGRLAVGDWLETGAASRVRMSVGSVGEVVVEPDTRLRLVETRANEHRLALARGTIRARIWAPPGQFLVETPSAVAVDLGCAYTLQVDPSGAGLVRVTLGWVGFEYQGRESFIPAGAFCATRPGVGPGTPYLKDTSLRFRAALTKLDFEKSTPEGSAAALDVVLSNARNRDAFTLWHLLSRVGDAERARVYDRLVALVPPPKAVTRDGVLRLDKSMLDLWWNKLGLGDTDWWRVWKRPWPQQAP